MNGQYLCNRQITVSYAYKKDTKGERHGTPAERVLAASNPGAQKNNRPHTLFASGPPTLPNITQANGAIAAPVPPRPYANGVAPPAIPALRPPPPPGSDNSTAYDASASCPAVQATSPEYASPSTSTGGASSPKASSTTSCNDRPTTCLAATATSTTAATGCAAPFISSILHASASSSKLKRFHPLGVLIPLFWKFPL